MRRSTLDIRLGRALTISEPWLDEAGVEWRVRMIHRADCHVELVNTAGDRICIRLAELRSTYRRAESRLEAA